MDAKSTLEYRAVFCGRTYDIVIFLSTSNRIPLGYVVDEILERMRPDGCYLRALYDMQTQIDLKEWSKDISRLINDGNPEIISFIESSHFPELGNLGSLCIHLPFELQVKLVELAEILKPEIVSALQKNLIQKAA